MNLLKYMPLSIVDKMVVVLARLHYGNLSRYGISKPNKGPFSSKEITGRTPTIDVGTVNKIKAGEIEVLFSH